MKKLFIIGSNDAELAEALNGHSIAFAYNTKKHNRRRYRMPNNVYSIDELRQLIRPIAEKYKIPRVYVFGSYARGEATEDSDVDILIDREGSIVRSLFDMGGLYNDLEESLGKSIDLVTTQTLEQESTIVRTPFFVNNLRREKVQIL